MGGVDKTNFITYDGQTEGLTDRGKKTVSPDFRHGGIKYQLQPIGLSPRKIRIFPVDTVSAR